MKTKHILYLILVAVVVLLYIVVRHSRHNRHHNRHGKARSKVAAMAANAALPSNPGPCDYLAEDFPKAAADCAQYQKMCGMASTANEVLNLEESASGSGDPRVLAWMKADADAVSKDAGECAPTMLCPDGQGDCPPEFPLKCVKGSCQ